MPAMNHAQGWARSANCLAHVDCRFRTAHHACRDAKVSVLHWDAHRHELAPSSLHYFEGDASLKEGRTVFPYPPLAVTGVGVLLSRAAAAQADCILQFVCGSGM